MDKLRALVEKWRSEAHNLDYSTTVEYFAGELEEVLDESPAPPVEIGGSVVATFGERKDGEMLHKMIARLDADDPIVVDILKRLQRLEEL